MTKLLLSPDQIANMTKRVASDEPSRWLATTGVQQLCADWQALHAANAALYAALRDLLALLRGGVVRLDDPAVIAARRLVGGADGG